MAKLMLLLYNDPTWYQKLSPEELQKATEKYMAWRALPYVTDGVRLQGDPGKVIRETNGKARSTEGPYSETKEILGGYYVLEAADYGEAVQRSLDHPHMHYGGTIEVRQVYAV